jgi:hypothetical protein
VFGNATDSAYRFRQVAGVMVLSDGRIAVADGASMQLRMYSPRGEFLSASAGRGRAPGQLLNMHSAARLRGDTIAIGSGLAAMSLYASTGQFIRSVAFAPPPSGRGGRPTLLVAVANNGTALAAPLPAPVLQPGRTRWTDSLALKIVTESGSAGRELGMFPYVTMALEDSQPRSVWLSAGGIAVGGSDRFYVGFGDRYDIRVYGSNGQLLSIIRRAWTPTPVTADDWEQWVVEWSKQWVKATGAERDREVQKVREEPWADALPAFSQFIVDADDRLWVRGAHWQDAIAAGSLADTPAVPSTWSVFDARGRWLGEVNMPSGFKPLEIGKDYVAGVRRTNGVNQVAIFELGVQVGR